MDEEGFLKKVLAFGSRGVGSIGQAALEQGLRQWTYIGKGMETWTILAWCG